MSDKVFISVDLEKELKDEAVKTVKKNLYNLYEGQSYDIQKLKGLLGDRERNTKLKTAVAQIADNTLKLKTTTNKDKPAVQLEIDRGTFIKGKLIAETDKLYEDIHARSKKIKAQIEFLNFVQLYNFAEPEKLPYAIVGETMYSMIDNEFEQNEWGQKVLYVKPKSK